MNIKSFLGVVEIRTKVASIIPLLLGTIYAVHHFRKFEVWNFLTFFGALICIDMVTTALNNYFDFLIDDKIIVEIKQGNHFSKGHFEQITRYLKVSDLKLGLLINFSSTGVQVKRILNLY